MTLPTSKHILGATELTLLADIKDEFVTIPEPTTHVTRLATLLETLFQMRQVSVEMTGLVNEAGPLETLRVLQRVHWSIVDGRRLLLTVAFDGPWEPYIRRIVEVSGPLLDAIFCHCVGFAGNSCFDGYAPFAEWVRTKQQGSRFFFAAQPQRTTDDMRYLEQLEQQLERSTDLENFPRRAATLRVDDPPPGKDAVRFRVALEILARLRRLFPVGAALDSRNDQFLFDRLAALIIGPLRPDEDPTVLGARDKLLYGWADALKANEFKFQRRQSSSFTNQLEPDALSKVQGNILSSYGKLTDGYLILGRFEGRAEAAAFLGNWKSRITTEALELQGRSSPDWTRINLALTWGGLATLGLTSEELALFPKEFQEGMEERAGMLGDIGPSHPELWDLPNLEGAEAGSKVTLSTVDFVIQVQSTTPPADVLAELKGSPEIQVLHVQPLKRVFANDAGLPAQALGKVREHFGFLDGFSQPKPTAGEPGVFSGDEVALGEILLGYQNNRGEPLESDPFYRLPHELLKNSSFLVVRKLAQNVEGFAALAATEREKLLGRHADGRPLVPHDPVDWNRFDYAGDREGVECPIFSHIRRANPREHSVVNGKALGTPRIMRRGFGYDSGTEKGLMFMAYNASIADQFEVVQRWVNGGNSSGGFSGHPDLVGGTFFSEPARKPDESERPQRSLSYPEGEGVHPVKIPKKPYVRLRWGLYLFAPSLDAIEALEERAARVEAPVADALLQRAREFIDSLAQLASANPARANLLWKGVLEDRLQRALARAVWLVIRQRGGVLDTRTEYGVLVGSEQGVSRVLSDDTVFSVRGYWSRMKETFGVHYLGMDRCPISLTPGDPYPSEVAQQGGYDKQAQVNEYLKAISFEDAFANARNETLAWFDAQAAIAHQQPQPTLAIADLAELTRFVLGALARSYFGLPDGIRMTTGEEAADENDPITRCPLDFQRVSQYVFFPRPTDTLRRVAQNRGAQVLKVARAALAEGFHSPLLTQLAERTGVNLEQALIGSINGFVVPTSGTLLSVMNQWIESRELFRLQRWLLSPRTSAEPLLNGQPSLDEVRGTPLFKSLVRAMIGGPLPDLLHRTAHVDTTLAGGTGAIPVRAGQSIVISLSSAAAEGGYVPLLFGATRSAEQSATHACPGQGLAFGALLGVLVGTLKQRNLRRKTALRLSFG